MARRDLSDKRARRGARGAGGRAPRPGAFLIVTEGTRTEPYYFGALASEVEAVRGGRFDVYGAPLVEVSGEGRGTTSLVEKAAEIVNQSPRTYSHVWVVFDKDDFADFDQAIASAEAQGMSVAWSNQSFEYWLYLHFEYSDSALGRHDWVKKLNALFKERGVRDDGYEKNLSDVYELVKSGEARAMRFAERIRRRHGNVPPSKKDPCTTVDLLVRELRNLISDSSRV